MEISEKNRHILEEFKKNVSDVLVATHSDAYLMKWLRAGNFNLQKCEFMYREALWCRAVYDLDSRTEQKKPGIAEKYEFVAPLGFAKDGSPVSYIAMGRGDYKGFVYSMNVYEICLYCSTIIEHDIRRAREQGKKLGKEMNEITYIIDMEGFYIQKIFHTCVLEMCYDLFRMLQDQYPEIWKHLLVVNSQFYVYQAFNIMRPIFRDNLLQNIRVVSKEDTPSLLLKYIDAEVLPVFLGGNRVDSKGDTMCSEFLKFGGDVPDNYYVGNSIPLEPTDSDVETVMLRPRSCYNHPIVVREPNSSLSVEIRTEGGSLSGQLLYTPFGPDPDDVDVPDTNEYLDPRDPKCKFRAVSPPCKLQTHITPASAICKVPRPGLYVYKLDNSSNWLTSRKVTFRFRVLPHL